MAKTKKVRALVDIPGVASCGQAVAIAADQVAGMRAAGVIDDAAEAVAYAESIGAVAAEAGADGAAEGEAAPA